MKEECAKLYQPNIFEKFTVGGKGSMDTQILLREEPDYNYERLKFNTRDYKPPKPAFDVSEMKNGAAGGDAHINRSVEELSCSDDSEEDTWANAKKLIGF
jgi:hypothetical protein